MSSLDGAIHYLLLDNIEHRSAFINKMKQYDINCVFHYVPLHSSTMGLGFAKSKPDLPVTTDVADRLVRIPLWVGLSGTSQNAVVSAVIDYF